MLWYLYIQRLAWGWPIMREGDIMEFVVYKLGYYWNEQYSDFISQLPYATHMSEEEAEALAEEHDAEVMAV